MDMTEQDLRVQCLDLALKHQETVGQFNTAAFTPEAKDTVAVAAAFLAFVKGS